LLLLPWSSMRSSMHDGFISALRAYTPSALQTLARAADPGMQVEILPAPTRLFPPSLAVVFSRSSSAPTESSECSADRQPGE
ncbi:SAM-dependent methyltransferase, partial [Mycobacterium tuberculosis]